MSNLDNHCIEDNQLTSKKIRKRRASLLIATTPVLDYVNGSMQPIILNEIVPYLSKNKKGQCDGKNTTNS